MGLEICNKLLAQRRWWMLAGARTCDGWFQTAALGVTGCIVCSWLSLSGGEFSSSKHLQCFVSLSLSLSVCVVIGRRSLSLKSPRTSVSVWVIGHVTRYLEHRYLFSPDWDHPCLADLHVGTEPAIVCDRTLCTGTSARLHPILLVPVLEQTSRDVHISLSPTFSGFCYLSGADLSIPRGAKCVKLMRCIKPLSSRAQPGSSWHVTNLSDSYWNVAHKHCKLYWICLRDKQM